MIFKGVNRLFRGVIGCSKVLIGCFSPRARGASVRCGVGSRRRGTRYGQGSTYGRRGRRDAHQPSGTSGSALLPTTCTCLIGCFKAFIGCLWGV